MPLTRLRFENWSLGRRLALFTAILLVLASFGGALLVNSTFDLQVPRYQYNLAAWEFRNFPAKWLYDAGKLVRHGRSLEQQNADLARFLDLTRQIDALEQNGDDGTLAQLRAERDRLENRVEDTIEGRVSAVLEDEGLTRKFFILPRMVWPPVDFEFTDAPQTLAVSPRDHIALIDSIPLAAGLDQQETEQIENDIARQRNVATRAFPLSGIGAYPTIVSYTDDYQYLLQVVAHEWTHNYLFFHPLGFNYYKNNDTKTMNETVANLVGSEIAAAVVARWPLPAADTPSEVQPSQPPAPAPTVDSGAVLRDLRGKVDALLANGKIDEAEALMTQTQQEMQAEGVYIRRLNQAYFAFLNLYAGQAGSPVATSPIGPEIDELRRRSGSLERFMALVSRVTSVQQLEATLAGLR